MSESPIRTRVWLDCVVSIHAAVRRRAPASDEQLALAGHCSDQALLSMFHHRRRGWVPGVNAVAGRSIHLSTEGMSLMFRGAYEVTPAQDVALPPGWDFRQPGFGLPIVVRTDRCTDDPRCDLYPTEGIYQWATAWFDCTTDDTPILRIVDPTKTGPVVVAGRTVRLNFDALSFYELGASASKLRRQGVYGLLGGRGIGDRAGVYLLQDYDPDKVPLVMIHGLGSNPIIWSELSGAIWADPILRDSYQIIHVVFQTNAPLLVSRLRVQGYLDRMWMLLDPEHDDPARRKMVLIGHSLGGVVSRLLAVDSGQALWDAAFTMPPDELAGPVEDIAGIRSTFLIKPYPGVRALILLAAPHKGSPAASNIPGRIARVLIGRRAPEIQALRRLARTSPGSVRDELLDSYRLAKLNSITTLQGSQPVRRTGEALLPEPGVRYHTIAGDVQGEEGDGVVPLESSILQGADSTLIVNSGHALYRDPVVIARILAILHEERMRNPDADRGADRSDKATSSAWPPTHERPLTDVSGNAAMIPASPWHGVTAARNQEVSQ